MTAPRCGRRGTGAVEKCFLKNQMEHSSSGRMELDEQPITK